MTQNDPRHTKDSQTMNNQYIAFFYFCTQNRFCVSLQRKFFQYTIVIDQSVVKTTANQESQINYKHKTVREIVTLCVRIKY